MSAVLIPTGSEAAWLDARREGITASEIAIVMGLSPYSSPFALYHQKLGQLPELDETDAMQLGKHMESFVAARFIERHPEFWVGGDGRALYAHPDRPWQMATPDRLVSDIRLDMLPGVDEVFEEYEPYAVLECKIDGGSDEWGEDGTDEIPVHYRCQVLWQMDVMGVSTGYVACLLWNKRKVRVYELTMDAGALADLKIMRDTAQCFLDDIRDGTEPDVDWRPATRDALKHLHPSLEDRDVEIRRQLAISYQAACRRYKAAERRKDEMTNRVLAVLGTGRRAVDERTGDVIATRQVYDQKEYVRKACTVNKLVAAKARKEPSA